MADFILATGLILMVLAGWIFVQYLSRYYAAKHPEFGPSKEEGSGCGKSCHCSNGNCKNKHSRAETQPINHLTTMNNQERTS